jgi:signal transduction histidine kinase/ligand-binding sensor domain-containing protein
MHFVFRRLKSSARHSILKMAAVAGLFCLFSTRSILLGQTNSSLTDFSSSSWQIEQGLPQNSVSAMVQDHEGYLWLATYNGLARFDGVRFTIFDTANTPEFHDSRIMSLFEDKDGVLWIGHETGSLTKLDHGKFTDVKLPDDWPGGPVLGIGTDKDGVLWLLNYGGTLCSMNGDKFYAASVAQGLGVPSITQDDQDTLWVVRNGLLGSLRIGKLQPWLPDGQPDLRYVERVCACRSGGLWLLGGGRVMKWPGHGPVQDLGAAPWGPLYITALIETESGDLLAGTEDGLYLWSPDGSYRSFNDHNELTHNWVCCLTEDREGDIWVGTGGGGLDELRVRTVEMVKAPDDWQGHAVLAVTTNATGGLWLGTEGGGLYQFNGFEAKSATETNGLSNDYIWSTWEDNQSNLWVGTWANGLYRRQDGIFQELTNAVAPSEGVRALFHDDQGMWIGTPDGLIRYANGVFTNVTGSAGLILPDVRDIAEDQAGTIWFGMSGGGLGRIHNGNITQFLREDGLPSDFVWSLLTDSDGTLWIGTFDGGLCRLRDGKFSTITVQQGLPSDVICHIADDGNGNLWMSSYGGIFRVSKDELNKCADGKIAAVNCLFFDEANGLATLECSGGFQPSGCRTDDGLLWFPTIKGLAVIDPSKIKPNPYPPPVYIEEMMVDDQPVLNGPASLASVQVPPGKHRLEIRYTGLSLVSPERVQFKYQLEGLEPNWENVGTRRVAYFSYLKPGKYKFHVIARSNDGVWNNTGAVLTLTVIPWFWQTWWFDVTASVSGALLLSGIILAIARWRMRLKLDRLERQRAVEHERSRIARDIHDNLGANLTRISLLSQSAQGELNNPAQAAAQLDRIYETTRELTRAMDEIVWAVNPEHDTLDSLVNYLGKFAQDYLGSLGIRCRLDLPMQLPQWPITAEVRHHLFLAFKEALHNVVKHAAATEVSISMVTTPISFALSVRDNGRGFVPAALPVERESNSTVPIPRNGLTNMRKRLLKVGGYCRIDTTVGRGTEVKFVVPAPSYRFSPQDSFVEQESPPTVYSDEQ